MRERSVKRYPFETAEQALLDTLFLYVNHDV